MSAADTPGIPFPFASRTTTFTRELFARLAPSLPGHPRKNENDFGVDAPSSGVVVVPACGT
jgi:hypothetical protein